MPRIDVKIFQCNQINRKSFTDCAHTIETLENSQNDQVRSAFTLIKGQNSLELTFNRYSKVRSIARLFGIRIMELPSCSDRIPIAALNSLHSEFRRFSLAIRQSQCIQRATNLWTWNPRSKFELSDKYEFSLDFASTCTSRRSPFTKVHRRLN